MDDLGWGNFNYAVKDGIDGHLDITVCVLNSLHMYSITLGGPPTGYTAGGGPHSMHSTAPLIL